MDIQVIGPIASTGYGVVTTQLITSLLLASTEDVIIRCHPIGPIDSSQMPDSVRKCVGEAVRAELAAPNRPDYTLCIWHEWDHPPKMLGKSIRMADKYVAMPTFELDQIKPEAIECLSKCWRVLVSSKHCYDVLTCSGLCNVAMRQFHGVDQSIFKPIDLNRPSLLNSKMILVNIGKMEKRKGHDICIQAVAHMLKENKEVHLFAAWDNPFLPATTQMDLMNSWEAEAASSSGVNRSLIHHRISRIGWNSDPGFLNRVMNLAHVGLYPYRAEGWNLPLLESMSAGLRVVATGYSGPMEYLKQTEDSTLVLGDLVDAQDGIWFGPGRLEGKWMEPDLDGILANLHHFYHRWAKHELDKPSIETVRMASEFTWFKAATRVWNWLESGCELS
jgi:glycosyltransferase involved in cell wall biosynthesis